MGRKEHESDCYQRIRRPRVAKAYEDALDPTPGDGEIVVDQTMIGVNFADVMMRQGKYFIKPELPAVPGFEGAGTVTAVGAGVEEFLWGAELAMLSVTSGAYAEKTLYRRRTRFSCQRPSAMRLPVQVCFGG